MNARTSPPYLPAQRPTVGPLSPLVTSPDIEQADIEQAVIKQERRSPSPGLPLSAQLPRGRLVELVDGHDLSPLTTAVSCLRYAQQQGEPSAWLQFTQGPLFPPDLADSGIDLEALIVVQVPEHMGLFGLCKAAEFLLRSGGFGMVIMDLSQCRPARDTVWQGRLLALAREHDSWLLLLSPARKEGSLGPLVSLCIETPRVRCGPGLFQLIPRVRKDKSGLLQRLAPEQRRGPWGLL